MSHSRERREFGRRKMKIKNKWEVVLVLIVVAAGIVITTVAAIKAKEKRQVSTQAENKVSNNTSKSSVSQVREVPTSRSNLITSSSNVNNKKTLLIVDNNSGRKTRFDDFTPDYDVEYDVVKTAGDEYTALSSDTIPKNIMRIPHDGLPGFPPPPGITNDFNTNVELTADGAGFVIESQSLSGINHIFMKNNGKNTEIIPKPSANVDMDSNLKLSNNRVKSVIKLSNVVKSDPKHIPVFIDPQLESISNMKSGQRKVPESVKENAKIGIPVKIVSRIPISNEKRPIGLPLETSASMKIALPSLESAIRFLGLNDDFAHQIEYGPGVQPSIVKLPLPVRRFNSPNNERVKRESFYSPLNNRNSKLNPRKEINKKKSELNPKLIDRILASLQNKSVNFSDNNYSYTFPKQLKHHKNDERELNTEESRYIPFNERSFMPEEREDTDSGDSEGTNNENISPLFNFDDLENRFPSILSASRHHKHNDNNYSPDESRKQHKYGILGSGNFEIIRGGIYSDDESASNNVPNYAQENNENNENNENSEQNNRKSEQVLHDYTPNSESNGEDDSEPNQFGPFNVDFFTGSPVLGFQGYDNFGATSIDKYKTPSPVRSAVKHRGQRRQFYDSHSAASNLFTITNDKDLDFDS